MFAINGLTHLLDALVFGYSWSQLGQYMAFTAVRLLIAALTGVARRQGTGRQ